MILTNPITLVINHDLNHDHDDTWQWLINARLILKSNFQNDPFLAKLLVALLTIPPASSSTLYTCHSLTWSVTGQIFETSLEAFSQLQSGGDNDMKFNINRTNLTAMMMGRMQIREMILRYITRWN